MPQNQTISVASRTIKLVGWDFDPSAPGGGAAQLTVSIDGGPNQTYAFDSIDTLNVDINRLVADDMNLVRFLLAYWNGRSQDLANVAIVKNKNLTIDFNSPVPISLGV